MATKKSPIDWLNEAREPHIVYPIPVGAPGWKSAPNGTMLVSTPQEIKAYVQRIPYGYLATIEDLRAALAQAHGTDIACPVSTAIFLGVVARAAEEYRAQGQDNISPYWRILKPKGLLNPKYPGGVEAQRQRLEAEGFVLRHSKQGYTVQDYQEFLFNWS
jgi:alkylated DNA nucleotide flippase Atl1